jgi:putative phosphoesterase
MEIGVISDTHGLVRSEVYQAFDGVELILHAGDIGGCDVLIELEALAPVKAVAGNVDADLLGLYKEQLDFSLDGRSFQLQHVFREIPEVNGNDVMPARKIVIFGHSHQPMNRQVDDTLYFNPGSAGPRRFKLPVCVGRLTLEPDRVEGRIIYLER